MGVEIPDKTYFKIGEAAKLVEVEPYTIRYWEKEFKALRPAKTKSRQRLFRQKDVQLLFVIRHLLYEQRFTIDGARRKLRDLAAAGLSTEDVLAAIQAGRPLDVEVADANAPEEPAAVRALLDTRSDELDEVRAQLDAARARLEVVEAQLTKERAAAQAYRADRERLQASLAAVDGERAAARAADAARWRALVQAVAPRQPVRRVHEE